MNSVKLKKEITKLKQDMIECESLLEKLERLTNTEQTFSIEIKLKAQDFFLYHSLYRPEIDSTEINLIIKIIKESLEREIADHIVKFNNLSLSLE